MARRKRNAGGRLTLEYVERELAKMPRRFANETLTSDQVRYLVAKETALLQARDRLKGRGGNPRRRNPSLVSYLANPGQRAKIASDVQAVLYRHAKDGKYYLHVFGNQGDGTVKRFRGGEYLRIDNLPERTGVVLERMGDNLLVRHNEGLPLARKF